MQNEKDKIDTIISLTNRLNDLFEIGKKLPEYTDKHTEQYDKQIKFEIEHLNNSRICHYDGKNSLLGISHADISGINYEEVHKNLSTKFYDHNLMEEVRCMINTILDITDDTESDRQRINTYLKNMERFGEQSAFNHALRGNIEKQHCLENKTTSKFIGHMVVIKCPREPAGSRELIHEFAIGERLNELRKFLPNFAYVYDAFSCSGATVDNDTKEVLDFCTSEKDSVSYVVYENIDNSIPIYKLLEEDISDDEIIKKFYKYLMQIALSLNIAEQKFNFQHRDLHTKNVLIRHYSDKEFVIAYSHNNELCYVKSPGGISTFIDYGMSSGHLKNDKGETVNIGKVDSSGWSENVGISSYDGNVISDIYKLMCFFIRECINYKKINVALHISSILGTFFYGKQNMETDDIMNIIIKQWHVRYNIPYKIAKEKKYFIDDFIDYLNVFYEHFFEEPLLNDKIPDGFDLFGCFESCPNHDEIRKTLNIHIADIPSLNVFIENPNNETVKKNISDNIKLVIENEFTVLHNEVTDKHHKGFFYINDDEEKADNNIDHYTQSVQDLISIAGINFRLYNKIKMYTYCKNEFINNNDDFDKLIDFAREIYNKNNKYITSIKEAIKHNYLVVQKFIFGKEMKQQLTDEEVSMYNENMFYDIYSKYKATLNLLDEIGFNM